MADAEIDVIREIIASHPRPAGLSERRKRLDALGGQYALPTDVRVDAVDANGVAAEWTTTPGADPGRVIMFLHGGGYRQRHGDHGRLADHGSYPAIPPGAPEHPPRPPHERAERHRLA